MGGPNISGVHMYWQRVQTKKICPPMGKRAVWRCVPHSKQTNTCSNQSWAQEFSTLRGGGRLLCHQQKTKKSPKQQQPRIFIN